MAGRVGFQSSSTTVSSRQDQTTVHRSSSERAAEPRSIWFEKVSRALTRSGAGIFAVMLLKARRQLDCMGRDVPWQPTGGKERRG